LHKKSKLGLKLTIPLVLMDNQKLVSNLFLKYIMLVLFFIDKEQINSSLTHLNDAIGVKIIEDFKKAKFQGQTLFVRSILSKVGVLSY
jgi:hypothetical protein